MSKILPIRGCLRCLKPFRPNRPWQQFCGMSCRREASKEQVKVEYVCTYCGILSDTVDHIPPTSIRPMLVDLGLSAQYPFIVVRACRECNCALGDRALWTVEQRKEYIARWLRRRYRRYLAIPEWSQEALQALEYPLREMTIHGLAVKSLVLARIARAEGKETIVVRENAEPERALDLSKTNIRTSAVPPPVILPSADLIEKNRLKKKVEREERELARMKERLERGEA
jgi:hypothetical protein